MQEVKYGKRQLNGPKRMMGVNFVPDDCVTPGVEVFVAGIESVWSERLSSWSEQSGPWQITLPRQQACWERPDLTVPDMSPHSSLHVTVCFCLCVRVYGLLTCDSWWITGFAGLGSWVFFLGGMELYYVKTKDLKFLNILPLTLPTSSLNS